MLGRYGSLVWLPSPSHQVSFDLSCWFWFSCATFMISYGCDCCHLSLRCLLNSCCYLVICRHGDSFIVSVSSHDRHICLYFFFFFFVIIIAFSASGRVKDILYQDCELLQLVQLLEKIKTEVLRAISNPFPLRSGSQRAKNPRFVKLLSPLTFTKGIAIFRALPLLD